MRRDDAASTGTATAGRQVGIVKTHPAGRQGVRVGRPDRRMSVAAKIILRNIIGNEEDDVGFVRGLQTEGEGKQGDGE